MKIGVIGCDIVGLTFALLCEQNGHEILISDDNEDFIYKIAESGYNKVIKHHTYDNRATEFIEIIKKHI
jgi:Trk K+ transport system NAD-binding subunit